MMSKRPRDERLLAIYTLLLRRVGEWERFERLDDYFTRSLWEDEPECDLAWRECQVFSARPHERELFGELTQRKLHQGAFGPVSTAYGSGESRARQISLLTAPEDPEIETRVFSQAPDPRDEKVDPSKTDEQLEEIRSALRRSRALGERAQRGIDALLER
jgi:hypothetical protein